MKEKDILFLVISASILTLLWIGFNVYNSLVTSTINNVLGVQITPISPTFDTDTITMLKQRTVIQPDFASLDTASAASQDSATPTPSPLPEPTGSASSESPSPTPLDTQPTGVISPAPSTTDTPLQNVPAP